jgi:hypothetical protein
MSLLISYFYSYSHKIRYYKFIYINNHKYKQRDRYDFDIMQNHQTTTIKMKNLILIFFPILIK